MSGELRRDLLEPYQWPKEMSTPEFNTYRMPEGRERVLSASDQDLNRKLLLFQQYTLDVLRLLTNDMQLHEMAEIARADGADESAEEIEEARKKIRVTMAVISASFFGWAQRIRTAMAVQAAGLPPVDPAKVRLTRESDESCRFIDTRRHGGDA